MMTKTDDLNIDWMQCADEILTENGCGPVDPQDRERYDARLQRQRVVAENYRTGVEQGRKQMRRETVLECGTKLLGPPTGLQLARLNRVTNLDRMGELVDRMFDCDSWESWLASVAPPVPVWPMILERLSRICRLSPNIRVGQMLAHLGFLSEDFDGQSLGVVEDEALLAVAERHLANLTARGSTTQPAMPPETDKAVAARPTMPMLNS